jgi:hypothetical protein
METVNKITPEVMYFELDKEKVFKEVRHFNLIQGSSKFSDKLNVSHNRGFSKARYVYSLKIRRGKTWSKQITGLFPTHDSNLFFGDTSNKRSLLLVKFKENGNKLRLMYFNGFYPNDLGYFLKTHFCEGG